MLVSGSVCVRTVSLELLYASFGKRVRQNGVTRVTLWYFREVCASYCVLQLETLAFRCFRQLVVAASGEN